MTELIAHFQTFPHVIINIILEWAHINYNDIWYLALDTQTGKLCYKHDVKRHIALIEYHRPHIHTLLFNRTIEQNTSKEVTVYIDGEAIPAIELVLKIFHDESYRRDDEYPQLYIEYEHNEKMEYLSCSGTSRGYDPTNPQSFNGCILYRLNEADGQYFAHHVEIHHTMHDDDYTRLVTYNELRSIAYLHECSALKDEYIRRRMGNPYARDDMIAEMSYDQEIKVKMRTAIELMYTVYNPYLNIYEHMLYDYE
jgi:hypothetical protein